MHYALCTTYVQCTYCIALCTMHFALCTMHYALCTVHYICTLHYTLWTMQQGNPDKPRPRTHFPTMQRTDMKCYTIFHQTIVMLHKYIVQVLGQWSRLEKIPPYILCLHVCIFFLFLHLQLCLCICSCITCAFQVLYREPGEGLYLYFIRILRVTDII